MDAPHPACTVYNSPAETLEAGILKKLVEEMRGIRVELVPENRDGGPLCDGSRFSQEFAFTPRSLNRRFAEVNR